jgi:acyl-CoA hydrolase
MNYRTRKIVRPENLNSGGTLFGGVLMAWIDEEAAVYAICQLKTDKIVTKLISEINFVSPAKNGDIVEIGVIGTHFGTSSITLEVNVRNKKTGQDIVHIDKMVFVAVGPDGKSIPHGITKIEE